MMQSQLVLTISTKKSNHDVRYGKDHQYYFNHHTPSFLTQAQPKEAKIKLSRRQQRKILKVLGIAAMSTAIFLVIGHSTLAAGIPASAAATTMQSPLMPGNIQKIGMQFIKITTITGTILAVILSQMAGGYKMLRKSEEATKWLTDILKGYATVIIAPVLITIILLVANLLFSGVPMYVNPIK